LKFCSQYRSRTIYLAQLSLCRYGITISFHHGRRNKTISGGTRQPAVKSGCFSFCLIDGVVFLPPRRKKPGTKRARAEESSPKFQISWYLTSGRLSCQNIGSETISIYLEIYNGLSSSSSKGTRSCASSCSRRGVSCSRTYRLSSASARMNTL